MKLTPEQRIKRDQHSKLVSRIKAKLQDANRQAGWRNGATITSTIEELLDAWTYKCHSCNYREDFTTASILHIDALPESGVVVGWVCERCLAFFESCDFTATMARAVADYAERRQSLLEAIE